jgi:hypothetical protein
VKQKPSKMLQKQTKAVQGGGVAVRFCMVPVLLRPQVLGIKRTSGESKKAKSPNTRPIFLLLINGDNSEKEKN